MSSSANCKIMRIISLERYLRASQVSLGIKKNKCGEIVRGWIDDVITIDINHIWFLLFFSLPLTPSASFHFIPFCTLSLSVSFLSAVSVSLLLLVFFYSFALRLWFILSCLYGPRDFVIFRYSSPGRKELDRRSFAHTKHTSRPLF